MDRFLKGIGVVSMVASLAICLGLFSYCAFNHIHSCDFVYLAPIMQAPLFISGLACVWYSRYEDRNGSVFLALMTGALLVFTFLPYVRWLFR
jgi:hypothetical protein